MIAEIKTKKCRRQGERKLSGNRKGQKVGEKSKKTRGSVQVIHYYYIIYIFIQIIGVFNEIIFKKIFINRT